MRSQLSIQELLGCPLASDKYTNLCSTTASSGTQPARARSLWHCSKPAAARLMHSHSLAGGPAGVNPKLYNPRRPSARCCTKQLSSTSRSGIGWHRLASAGQFDGLGDHHSSKAHVPKALSSTRFHHAHRRARTKLPGCVSGSRNHAAPSIVLRKGKSVIGIKRG